MRSAVIAPSELTDEQRPFYDEMSGFISENLKGFKAVDETGALIGPFNPWLRHAKFGKPIWELVKALWADPALPIPVREIAILVTGAHFHAPYELYAHVAVAELKGLPDAKISTIAAGQRPADLTPEEGVAYDVASVLVRGSVLPEIVYRQSVATFGEAGAAELIYLVGLYCLVALTLNGFDIPVPEGA